MGNYNPSGLYPDPQQFFKLQRFHRADTHPVIFLKKNLKSLQGKYFSSKFLVFFQLLLKTKCCEVPRGGQHTFLLVGERIVLIL
jgi:hypothetical protein